MQCAKTLLYNAFPTATENQWSIVPLAGGYCNQVYRADHPAHPSVVVRVFGEHRATAAPCSLAPTVLYVGDCGSIEELVPGRTLTRADMQSERVRRIIAREMRRLHRMPHTGDTRCVWTKLIDQFARVAPTQPFEGLHLQCEAEKLIARIGSGSDPIAPCTHNDLQQNNMLYDETAASIRFIDFDFAGPNPIAFDLANFLCEAQLADQMDADTMDEPLPCARSFLDAYGDDRIAPERVALFITVSHLLWTLWALQPQYGASKWHRRYATMRARAYVAAQKRLQSPVTPTTMRTVIIGSWPAYAKAFWQEGKIAAERTFTEDRADYVWANAVPGDDHAIWDETDVFFIAIPKTGTQSVFARLPSRYAFGHMYGCYYPKRITRKLRTIVRNPYSRLVSAYYFMARGGFFNPPAYHDITDKYTDFEDWVLNGLTVNMITHATERPMTMEPIIMQTEWLIDHHKNAHQQEEALVLPVGQIGRFEQLNADAKRLFGIDDLPRKNVTSYRKPWQEHYGNRSVREKVHRLYERDFRMLGYPEQVPPPPPPLAPRSVASE